MPDLCVRLARMAETETYDEGKYVEAERGPLGSAYEWARSSAVKLAQRINNE